MHPFKRPTTSSNCGITVGGRKQRKRLVRSNGEAAPTPRRLTRMVNGGKPTRKQPPLKKHRQQRLERFKRSHWQRRPKRRLPAATDYSTTLCMYFVCVGRNDFGGRYSQAGSSRSSSSWWKKMATKMATEIMKMATEIMKMAPTASC